MKAHLLIEGVLIGLLGAHAWILLDRMPPSRAALERAAAEANQKLRFVNGRGIGVQGQRIDLGPRSDKEQLVAFLLRGSTLPDDLRFWEEVAKLTRPSSGVLLLGYCDGQACVETLTNRREPTSFPVIAYGEASPSQAVFNADLRGEFVTSREGSNGAWRQPSIRPIDIAEAFSQ